MVKSKVEEGALWKYLFLEVELKDADRRRQTTQISEFEMSVIESTLMFDNNNNNKKKTLSIFSRCADRIIILWLDEDLDFAKYCDFLLLMLVMSVDRGLAMCYEICLFLWNVVEDVK